MEILYTDRLIIRLARVGDEENIYSYRPNFIDNKYQGWLPNSIEEVRDHIKNMPTTIHMADDVIYAMLQKEWFNKIGK